jgi:hypothetical protein
MQLLDAIMAREGERVATAVTSGELWVNSAHRVQGLMNVTVIVDQ